MVFAVACGGKIFTQKNKTENVSPFVLWTCASRSGALQANAKPEETMAQKIPIQLVDNVSFPLFSFFPAYSSQLSNTSSFSCFMTTSVKTLVRFHFNKFSIDDAQAASVSLQLLRTGAQVRPEAKLNEAGIFPSDTIRIIGLAARGGQAKKNDPNAPSEEKQRVRDALASTLRVLAESNFATLNSIERTSDLVAAMNQFKDSCNWENNVEILQRLEGVILQISYEIKNIKNKFASRDIQGRKAAIKKLMDMLNNQIPLVLDMKIPPSMPSMIMLLGKHGSKDKAIKEFEKHREMNEFIHDIPVRTHTHIRAHPHIHELAAH